MVDNTKKSTESADSSANASGANATAQPDESTLKTVSAVGYLGILFLVPMLMFPKEKFAMFHANQGLLLLITAAIVNIAGSIIPVLGWFIILPLGNLAVLALFIIGLVNALGGKMQRLPVVGKADILKVQE